MDGEQIEAVKDFVFLGLKITSNGDCQPEIKRRLALGRTTMGRLTNVWKDREETSQ